MFHRIAVEPIKEFSDPQPDLSVIPAVVKRGKYKSESTLTLSIHGEAPKCFLHLKEYREDRPVQSRERWIAYIAKVGSKSYPMESITEHLFARIGQCLGFKVAHSRLRVVGGQLRFLSRYFLRRRMESLVHGIEIFKHHVGHDFVEEVAAQRVEQEVYTFQTVCAAMKDRFPSDHDRLMRGLVEMLAFDTIVGATDRHPANWGVIVPITSKGKPRFAPIYDTARGLYWNYPEKRVRQCLSDRGAFDAYIARSEPLIGWDGQASVKHFSLIERIYQDFEAFRGVLAKFAAPEPVDSCLEVINAEFSELMSPDRRELIGRTLRRRWELFVKAIS